MARSPRTVPATIAVLWLALTTSGCVSPHDPATREGTAAAAAPRVKDLDELSRRLDLSESESLGDLARELLTDLETRAMGDVDGRDASQRGTFIVLPTALARGRVQTSSTRQLNGALGSAARDRFSRIPMLTFSRRNAAEARWALASTVVSTGPAEEAYAPRVAKDTARNPAAAPRRTGHVVPALLACAYFVRLATGHVVAAAGRVFDSALFDLAPSRFDRDRMVLPTGQAGIPDRARCTDPGVMQAAGIGREAALTMATLQPALTAYSDGDDPLARRYFERAFSGGLPAGAADRETLLNGRYLVALRARPVAQGLVEARMQTLVDEVVDAGALPLNLGFAAGSTYSASEAWLRERHPAWLQAIARRAESIGRCVQVVAHTSAQAEGGHPDPADVALQRARGVRRLIDDSRALPRGSVRAYGRLDAGLMSGVGTGDARDAWDRFVELQVAPC